MKYSYPSEVLSISSYSWYYFQLYPFQYDNAASMMMIDLSICKDGPH